MKASLRAALLAMPGLACWCWLVPAGQGDTPPAGPARPVSRPAARPTGRSLTGTLLAPPSQVLRSPQAGRVEAIYCSDEQSVKPGQVLLRVASQSVGRPRRVYWVAPAGGEIITLGRRVGEYVAVGTPYARLRQSSPARVLATAEATGQLRVDDTLQVQAGPAGLIGRTAALTTILPQANGSGVVLVLAPLRWPRDATARVVLAPLRPSREKPQFSHADNGLRSASTNPAHSPGHSRQ